MAKKIPRARAKDTIEDLEQDDMLTSGPPWVRSRQRKKKKGLEVVMDLTSKNKLIEINRKFSDGTVRYDGCLENLEGKTVLEIAKIVASEHPFMDGNKRTAIKFCELMLQKKVPAFVYQILERA